MSVVAAMDSQPDCLQTGSPMSALAERCPRGRRSTPGKCVYGNVSRVRIPPSPPDVVYNYLFYLTNLVNISTSSPFGPHIRFSIGRPPATNRPIAFPRVSRRSGPWSHKPFVIAPKPAPQPDTTVQRPSVALPLTVAGRTRRRTLAGAGCASRPSPSATAGWLRQRPISAVLVGVRRGDHSDEDARDSGCGDGCARNGIPRG